MKTPPFLLGATALFWGWQAELYPPAIICALVMEASALTKTRLAFELREYKMIWNLSVLILFAALAYLLSTESPPEAFLTLAKWLPLIFLPIAAAQAHGAADRVPLAALSWVFRGSGSNLNLTYPYFVMLMASASAANVRSLGFYAFLGVFSFWALWSIRPRSYSVYTWVISFALVLLTGYAGAVGLNRLQAIVENSLVNLYAKMFLNQPDPFTTNTSIGEVGSLKTSGAIQLRVQTSNGYTTPIYLALAGYNTYKSGSWFAMKSPLVSKTSEPSGLAWKLAEAAGEESYIAVSMYLYGGTGLIPAPVNAHKLERLPAHKMYVNSLGVIKAGGTPDFFRYLISSNPQAARISAPDENDLKVPLEEEAVISRAAAQIGIIGKEDKAVVAALDRYFQKNFSYSLDLSPTPGVSAIEDFLFNSRRGHCEYFATATVLLLRKAGIPARYFVGYLASEYSAMEDAFIVRSRDAHAWPMAYMDGSWRLVDTTPYSWLEADRENSHALEGFHDLLSYLFLQFSRWRWGEITLFNTQRLALLLIPLFLLLGWRIVSTTRLSRKKEAAFDRRQKSHVPGTASVFYLVERRLNELGYTRASWETEAEFIHRVISLRTELHGETALALLELHYRLRFDPKGLTEAQKEKMIHLTGLWLEQSRNVAPSPAVQAAPELEPNP